MGTGASVSLDRAADSYDATRVTAAEGLSRILALETWFEEIRAKEASWTWRVHDAALRAAVAPVREEVTAREGEPSRAVPAVATRWPVDRSSA